MLNIKGSLGGRRRRENPPEKVCHRWSLVLEWKMMERLSERWMQMNPAEPVRLYILTFALLRLETPTPVLQKAYLCMFFPLTKPLTLALSLSLTHPLFLTLQWRKKKSVMKHLPGWLTSCRVCTENIFSKSVAKVFLCLGKFTIQYSVFLRPRIFAFSSPYNWFPHTRLDQVPPLSVCSAQQVPQR